eukprot:gnl/Dysnectes_brevis/2580_a3110_837.p1 GENE.gnl/Dysnectes_brevis/2580_a3110_837~~gnl/Dysnectes_brevis/2580_a3110_837.p1  ORF type:complete len:899 (-),score=271.09 gnl/Dysnectes_brevis/2580_a3110_837:64-2760(-)
MDFLSFDADIHLAPSVGGSLLSEQTQSIQEFLFQPSSIFCPDISTTDDPVSLDHVFGEPVYFFNSEGRVVELTSFEDNEDIWKPISQQQQDAVEQAQCPICYAVHIEMLEVPQCAHQFCYNCLTSYSQNSNSTCPHPECQRFFGVVDYCKPVMQHQLRLVPITCPYGCGFKGNAKDLGAHCRTCRAPCPREGCGLQHLIAQESMAVCPCRDIPCSFSACSYAGNGEDMVDHIERVHPENDVPCHSMGRMVALAAVGRANDCGDILFPLETLVLDNTLDFGDTRLSEAAGHLCMYCSQLRSLELRDLPLLPPFGKGISTLHRLERIRIGGLPSSTTRSLLTSLLRVMGDNRLPHMQQVRVSYPDYASRDLLDSLFSLAAQGIEVKMEKADKNYSHALQSLMSMCNAPLPRVLELDEFESADLLHTVIECFRGMTKSASMPDTLQVHELRIPLTGFMHTDVATAVTTPSSRLFLFDLVSVQLWVQLAELVREWGPLKRISFGVPATPSTFVYDNSPAFARNSQAFAKFFMVCADTSVTLNHGALSLFNHKFFRGFAKAVDLSPCSRPLTLAVLAGASCLGILQPGRQLTIDWSREVTIARTEQGAVHQVFNIPRANSIRDLLQVLDGWEPSRIVIQNMHLHALPLFDCPELVARLILRLAELERSGTSLVGSDPALVGLVSAVQPHRFRSGRGDLDFGSRVHPALAVHLAVALSQNGVCPRRVVFPVFFRVSSDDEVSAAVSGPEVADTLDEPHLMMLIDAIVRWTRIPNGHFRSIELKHGSALMSGDLSMPLVARLLVALSHIPQVTLGEKNSFLERVSSCLRGNQRTLKLFLEGEAGESLYIKLLKQECLWSRWKVKRLVLNGHLPDVSMEDLKTIVDTHHVKYRNDYRFSDDIVALK